jgi:hypothetical protein
MSDQQPVTKVELVQAIAESEARITATVREIETNLLRAFHDYALGVSVRFRKIEADLSNIDAAALARLDAVEQRLLSLEMRLPPSAARQ